MRASDTMQGRVLPDLRQGAVIKDQSMLTMFARLACWHSFDCQDLI